MHWEYSLATIAVLLNDCQQFVFKAPCGKELLQSYAGQCMHGTLVHHSTVRPVYVFTTFSAFKG